jgi:hypothetical protein
MGQAPVTQRISVVDAEAEAQDIEVGQDRTKSTGNPEALGNSRPVEAGADTERCDRVGER